MNKISTFALTMALAAGLATAAVAQTMTPSSPGATPSSPGMTPSSPDTTAPSSGSAAQSGDQGMSSSGGQVASATDVKAKLEASGFTNVQSIHKAKAGWTAVAEQNGKRVHVAVDDHGNIATQ